MWLRLAAVTALLLLVCCKTEKNEDGTSQAAAAAATGDTCYRHLEAELAKLSAGEPESNRMQLALDNARTRLGERIRACVARLETSGSATARSSAEMLHLLLDANLEKTTDEAIMIKLRTLASGDDPPAVLAGLVTWQLARDAFVAMARLAPDDPERAAVARFALLGIFDQVPVQSEFETDFSRALEQTVVASRPVLKETFDAAQPEEKARRIAQEVSLRSAVQLLRIARNHPDSVWTPAIRRAWESFRKQHPDEAAAARALLEP